MVFRSIDPGKEIAEMHGTKSWSRGQKQSSWLKERVSFYNHAPHIMALLRMAG
jgi:hypothetical protein